MLFFSQVLVLFFAFSELRRGGEKLFFKYLLEWKGFFFFVEVKIFTVTIFEGCSVLTENN